MKIVDPHPSSVSEVLNQRPIVPEFQRSFSWELGTVGLFVEALLEQTAKPQEDQLFIGQVVAYNGAEDGKPFLGIIDGQQRLTTITVIAAVVRDHLLGIGSDGAKDAAVKVHERLIWPADYTGKPEPFPYLRLNSYDADYFRTRVQSEDINPDAQIEFDSHKRINATYLEVAKLVADHVDTEAEELARVEKLAGIATTLGEQLSLIIVRGSNAEGASDLFEVLNDRSVALTSVDLLKNFLAGRAESNAAVSEVVAGLAPVFELGADNESLVNQFLRHYWISQNNDEKRGLYRVIRNDLAAKIDSGMKSPALALDFGDAARQYADLVEAETGNESVDALLMKVRLAQAHSLYPLLLASFRNLDLSDLEPITNAGLVLYTRWSIIGRLDSSDLEDVLFTQAFKVSNEGATAAEVVTALANACPTNSEFREALAEASIRKPAWRRYVLYCLEEQLRKDDGKEELKIAAEKCHVEHVYPQTPAKRFKQHDDLVNRLGNLTLLGASINTGLKNSPYSKKRARYKEKSELELTRQIAENYETWGAKAIRERQGSLAGLGLKTWPKPS